jgi:hypothetical protein
LLVQRRESCEQSEQGSWRSRFNNQFVAILSHNGLIARQLELPRNSDGLISAILEELDVPFWYHRIPRANIGICQSICQLASLRKAMRISVTTHAVALPADSRAQLLRCLVAGFAVPLPVANPRKSFIDRDPY